MERRKRRKYNRKSSNTHISLVVIKQYLLYGVYPNGSTPSDKRSVRKRSQSFKIEDGELFYVVRPKHIEGEPPDPNPRENKQNLRKAVLSVKDQLSVASSVHVQGNGGNHMGTERTLSSLSSKYYWVGMAATVRKVLKNCIVCLASRPAVSILPSDLEESTSFSQTWDPDASLLIPKSAAVDEKKQAIAPKATDIDTQCNVLSEGEGEFVVTNELTEPEDIDSDLGFDPGSAIPDSLFDAKVDVHKARRFWHKVGIQILGPYQHKKGRSVFVVAAMDSFSKWPEVQTLDTVDEKTVAHFCLKLIARYGMMEHLILLENDVSAKKPLDASGVSQNLQTFAVNVSKEDSDPMDEHWCNLYVAVERFVNIYTIDWPNCLDICLLPLRNTVSQVTEFTPAYLLMGREPSFPGTILPPKQSMNSEISLNLEQIYQAVDETMAIYQQCSVPDIKHVLEPSVSISTIDAERKAFPCENPPDSGAVQKAARKSRKPLRFMEQNEKREKLDKPIGDNYDMTSLVVINGQFKKRNLESSILYKKKENIGPNGKPDIQDSSVADDEEDIFQKHSLDTYYRIIHLYKAEGNYPANSPAAFKRNVRRVAETFVYENGLLLYKGKPDSLSQRETVMTTEERLAKMSEAHVKNGDHLSQFKVLDSLNSEKLYWKGMHTDVKAFVSACPGCRFGETKKKRKMQIKHLRWFKAAASDSEGDSDAETNIGNLSYNDLWMFIKRGVTPDTLSRSELLMFRKRAKSFKIEKGVLYYCPSNDGKKKARKVLRTEKEKQELIKKTHLGPGGDHLNPRAMKEILRTSVFWYGMSSDVENFVAQCCQCQFHEQSKPSEESDRQETALEEKVKLFQDYFAGKDIIPKQENLDLLFPKKENENDLVAEAMESAAVISPNLTNKSNKILQEDGDQTASNNGESQISTTSFSTGTESGKVYCEEVKESTLKLADEDSNGDHTEDVAQEEIKSKPFSINLKRIGSLSTQLRKSPLSVPKLPRTRKRCEICSEVILGENNFKAHMYKHTGVKPFQCNLCPKKFTNVKGLRLHSRKHTGHRPFLCSICGRGFPRSASLRYHIKTHERGNNSPITCDECQRTFTTMNRLIKHKGYKHPAKPPVYSCGQCGKCFTAKRSLKRHEDAHQGIRKYVCKYCKRRFFRKEYLNYHEVSHANEDPSILTNHKFRNKAKRPLPSNTKKKALPDGLLTFTLDSSSAAGLTQNQETYGQVVEVPDGWPQLQREQTFIYELCPDGNLVPTDPSQIGGATTTMVVMEAPSVGSATVSDTGMEFRHIFLPSEDVSHVQQQTHHAQVPHQQQYVHHHHHQQQVEKVDQGQQQQHHENQSEEEIKFPPQSTDSLQQQHQYQQEQQQQQETHISPTVIKYTQEDIVSLQHHQHNSNQEHYQQAPREISNAEQRISTDVSLQEPKSIEISLPSGTSHTFTLPAGVVGNSLVAAAGNPGEDTTTVQYQVECLSGETLTEADFNAIRKLAQASLAGGSHHLSQQ